MAADDAAAFAERESFVRVARTVLEATDHLPPEQAAAVTRTIHRIGHERGEPIWLPVPEAPEGSRFLTLVPDDDPGAPAVIYRRLLRKEGEGWRVVALMDRDAYDDYRSAERRGLFNDPAVREAAVAATNVAINTSGTISTVGITPKDGRR